MLLVAAVLVAIFLPALQLREVSVSGLGYVQEDEVRSVLDQDLGDSVLLLPTTDIAERVEAVPGVESAEVHRSWPDGATVTITESEPVAVLTTTDGTSAVIDGSGQELPADAGEGAELIPLTVDGGSADPEGAATALSEVLASMPDSLRGSVQEMTASSASDVQLVLALEDGGTKTVVWGGRRRFDAQGRGGPGTDRAARHRDRRLLPGRTRHALTRRFGPGRVRLSTVRGRHAPDTHPWCLRGSEVRP